MTKEEKLANEKAVAIERYKRLSNSPKNIKCPGVLRKIRRTIRNMDK